MNKVKLLSRVIDIKKIFFGDTEWVKVELYLENNPNKRKNLWNKASTFILQCKEEYNPKLYQYLSEKPQYLFPSNILCAINIDPEKHIVISIRKIDFGPTIDTPHKIDIIYDLKNNKGLY